jgi:type I restriction enzyme S subunit
MTWTDTRIKHLCVDAGQYGLNVSALDYTSSGYRLIRISDIDEAGHLRSRDGAVFVDARLGPRHQLKAGDILLARSGATVGRAMLTGELQEPSTYAGYLIRFRPLSSTEPRFLAYFATSHGFQSTIESDAVTSTIQNFNAERYANIPVSIPSFEEQRRIADFLDTETSRLDDLIALIKRQREVLNNRRQALIDTETRQSKDEIPLKYVARISYGLGQPPQLSEAGIPILRATNIKHGNFIFDDLIFSTVEDLPLDRAPLLHEGEILVVRSGAYTGDSAMVTKSWAGCAPGYDLRVTPMTGDSRFIEYCLLSTPTLDQVDLAKSRAAQPHLNAEDLGNVVIPIPPIDQQRHIADVLDAETAEIDQLGEMRKQQLGVLSERRQSLITAAVTGGITV